MTPITIATNVLAAIVKWACTDTTRPHLCTVLFERDLAVATDGHRIVLLPVPTNGHRLLVDAKHLSAAVVSQREMNVARPHSIGIQPGDGNVVLTIDKGVNLVVPSRNPSQYPPYENVIPKVDPAAGAPNGYVFNPQHLAAIAEVHAAVAPNTQHGVRVVAWQADHLGAMLFEGYEGTRFVVMPMRYP